MAWKQAIVMVTWRIWWLNVINGFCLSPGLWRFTDGCQGLAMCGSHSCAAMLVHASKCNVQLHHSINIHARFWPFNPKYQCKDPCERAGKGRSAYQYFHSPLAASRRALAWVFRSFLCGNRWGFEVMPIRQSCVRHAGETVPVLSETWPSEWISQRQPNNRGCHANVRPWSMGLIVFSKFMSIFRFAAWH